MVILFSQFHGMNDHQPPAFSFFKGDNFKGNSPVIKAGNKPFKRRVFQHYIRRAVKQARIDTFRAYPMLAGFLKEKISVPAGFDTMGRGSRKNRAGVRQGRPLRFKTLEIRPVIYPTRTTPASLKEASIPATLSWFIPATQFKSTRTFPQNLAASRALEPRQ